MIYPYIYIILYTVMYIYKYIYIHTYTDTYNTYRYYTWPSRTKANKQCNLNISPTLRGDPDFLWVDESYSLISGSLTPSEHAALWSPTWHSSKTSVKSLSSCSDLASAALVWDLTNLCLHHGKMLLPPEKNMTFHQRKIRTWARQIGIWASNMRVESTTVQGGAPVCKDIWLI